MVFVHALLGVHFEGDTKKSEFKCVGEVVCPECQKVMGRLEERPEGVAFHAWVPGQNPSAPELRTGGWEIFAHLGDDTEDHEGAVLECWKFHGPWWVNAGLCRELVARYRNSGKKARQLARTPTEDELIRSMD